MEGIFVKLRLFLLLVLTATVFLSSSTSSSFVYAEEDDIEDVVEGEEDDEVTVETEDAIMDTGADVTEPEESEEPSITSSPDAKTHILFISPQGTDYPAGQPVKFLVGFHNEGESDFVIDTMEASFRYPQDFSYFIQNFTTYRYERVVESSRQATLEYTLTPSESFNGRPFGLVVLLNYHDTDGGLFSDAVYNETVTVVETDAGLDGETFFLYTLMAAVTVLLLVGAQQLLAGVSKKRLTGSRQPVEMGTQNNKSDVDYDWLPKETIEGMNKSPRRSPRQSPGRRRAKRGSGEEN